MITYPNGQTVNFGYGSLSQDFRLTQIWNKKNGGSTLSNSGVEQCVKSNVMRLKFPAKGAIANVTYPFVFSQGG